MHRAEAQLLMELIDEYEAEQNAGRGKSTVASPLRVTCADLARLLFAK
jgi:hypothetical protein